MYGPMRPPPPPEPSIDDLIEDSDDGEELIDYKMDEPELRYRRACEADVDKQFFMRAWCMTWAGVAAVSNLLEIESQNLPSSHCYQGPCAAFKRSIS